MITQLIENYYHDYNLPYHFQSIKDQKIKEVFDYNLTTNEDKTKKIIATDCDSLSITLKEKIKRVFFHIVKNPSVYIETFCAIAGLGIAAKVTLLGKNQINTYLSKLYQDIKLGRLVYVPANQQYNPYFYHYEKVGLDYYYQQAIGAWAFFSLFAVTTLAALTTIISEKLSEIRTSLNDYFSDRNVKFTIEVKDSSYPSSNNLETIGNDGTTDPFSFIELKEEWIHAPRFLKIINQVVSLDTFFKFIFIEPLRENKIYSPLHSRFLTDEENQNLIQNVSDLLGINSEILLQIWNDPYFCDKRKLNYPNSTPAEIEDILFTQDLGKLYQPIQTTRHNVTWINWNTEQQSYVKQKVKKDVFHFLKLQNLILELPEKSLNLEIKLNDEDSFTFLSLMKEIKDKMVCALKNVDQD